MRLAVSRVHWRVPADGIVPLSIPPQPCNQVSVSLSVLIYIPENSLLLPFGETQVHSLEITAVRGVPRI
jgi:hypothetical protein